LIPDPYLWIPITLFAALAQTIRNAAQRQLTSSLGTVGATWVRFLYGLPFALVWLAVVLVVTGSALPIPDLRFLLCVSAGALAQVLATALLLRVMAASNFALGVAYSKTEAMQVAVFGLLFLGDPITSWMVVAIMIGTVGVLLISPSDPERPFAALVTNWTQPIALLGLASGALFGLAAVGYRASALALGDTPFVLAAAFGLVVAQSLQTVVTGAWMLHQQPEAIMPVFRAWRASLLAGGMGAAASAGWFTAMAIESVARVRTLALAELLFAGLISLRYFDERLTPREILGIALLGTGLVAVTLG
jgi:drug/metabolite transporter (DMT)-like permease